MNRGKGIGKKKIKISSSYRQIPAPTSGGKQFTTKPSTPKKHGSKSYEKTTQISSWNKGIDGDLKVSKIDTIIN